MLWEKNPNGEESSERIYNWGDIKKEIISETPKEGSFEGCYSQKEIKADRERIAKIKERLGVKDEDGISTSRIQEYAIAQEIGEMDWFGEDKRSNELFPSEKGQQTVVFLSSEFDDFVNHVDAVCVMDNAESDFEPVPFALDMTYNTDVEGLDKKMSWRHPSAGVKIPGFAMVKYFQDTFSPNPLLKKGKISIMPRFVIGFEPDLSTEITELRMTNTGWDSLRRDELTAKAKWCVLRELKAQSAQMLEYLNEHHADSPLLETAYSQIKSLDRYFAGAIEAAKGMDKNHPERQAYSNRDAVVQSILSRNIYN
ncbi:MAG: hypothetical protein Q4A36_03560 [Candidatus Saccharibacteria bacterium]|nr:hypothetical protein [Candidatus Saccharibacteria bacterium]